jgi:hypothetical protein
MGPAVVLWIHVFFFLCLLPSRAEGQGSKEGRDILAIGTGPVTEENVARARTAAVEEALTKGVEQYLLRTLGEQGGILHFPKLVRDMIPTEQREIENFTILAEERMGRHYKVLVRMRINERVMAERFREHGIALVKEQPVAALFLVSQVEQPENRVFYWWAAPEDRMPFSVVELALHQVFEGLGFLPVNRLTKPLEGRYGPEMTAPDLSHEEAFQWGELFAVPVVVQGRCEIIRQKEVHVFLEALGIEKRIVIGHDFRSEIAGEGAEALKRALDKAIRDIAATMTPMIRKAVGAGEREASRIEVLVKGLRSFRDLRSVKEALEKEIAGVTSVTQTRVVGDSVGLMVDFSGTREQFLQRISGPETLPFFKEDSPVEEETIILRPR